ncbi:MAG: N-6 DNA methylase [Saprospiraceae bacterium]|nr:N-6 DNA methylase [Saprospiraceae bacterium]
MSLFQKSVEKKYLAGLDSVLIDKKFSDFQEYFGNSVIQENIRNAKEEQFQEGFFRELFVKILDYTLNPDPNFNLTTEFKNVDDSKKADGAILRNENAIAVIELKSTSTTDLSSVETQAFGYKNHHPNCTYIITSNFEKLRFYIQNAVDYLEFDLFNLNREQFCLLWLCLAKDNILNDLPLTIKESSVIQEESVTKQLYADYSKFREEVFDSILKNNLNGEQGTVDPLILFKKTQKLLDRFLFIFFTEDTGLLPPNTITEIVNQWIELKEKFDEDFSLYSRFVKFFGYLNTGYKGKKYDIYPYNGGLFLPDEILDNINIDDEILKKHTLKLTAYDFETDIDVNILGHIFEHSLSEIENIQAKLRGETIDNQKSKRKKDGIFYTPKYITKYIVENTIGKLCDEKRIELEIIDEEYAKGRKNRKKEILKNLDDKLSQYRKWLLNLTILDPACGSGAFLNQALEFLINEHRKIDELRAQLLGGTIVFSDITNDILEKNIFGVDINEESVEIAKLSLWLRTAQKGRKLSTLSNNIKCGNSLIDDAEIAGDKAFNWQKEFPNIFAKGGFDVVIGNPPYGDYFNEKEKIFILKRYAKSFSGTFDMYIVFFEISLNILKTKGTLCFITPNTFIDYSQFAGLRTLLTTNNNVEQVIGLTKVFEEAIVDTAIILITKNKTQSPFFRGKIFRNKLTELNNIPEINAENLETSGFTIKDSGGFDVRSLSNKFPIKLSDVIKITQGITTGGNESFLNKESYFLDNRISEKYFHKVLKGKTINRYRILYDDDYILYSTKYTDVKEQRVIENLLIPFKEKLSKKRETKQGKLPWYCLHWPRNEKDFNEPKILIRQTATHILGVLDIHNYYPIDSIHTLNLKVESDDKERELKFLLGILNSKLFKYLYSWKLDEIGTVYPQVKKVNIEWFPIVKYDISERLSVIVAKLLSVLEQESKIRVNFLKFLDIQIKGVYQYSGIQSWHELEFGEFIIELNKAIKKVGKTALTKLQEMEWMEIFETKKAEAQKLQTEITKTDKEIDQMVYKLYGLTEEEIGIVEGE